MIYRAEVKETHRRTVYVEAGSAQEAKDKAREGNWWDADDPDTAVSIVVEVVRKDAAMSREP